MIYYIIVKDGVIIQKGFSSKEVTGAVTPVSEDEYDTLDIGDIHS